MKPAVKAPKKVGEALGHAIFYAVIKISGLRGGYFLLAFVTFGYVTGSRKIHLTLRPYIARRFPDHNWILRWLDTLRLVFRFGQILVDRAWLGLKPKAELDARIEGFERLQELLQEGKGLVLLTAHVGNWQTALSHLNKLQVPVNVLMHYDEEAVAKHYFDLQGKKCPFNIINTEGFLGGMVEATAALVRGEVVTIMGDRFTKGPAVRVPFLGREVNLPAASFALAATAHAPVAVILAAKTGAKGYLLRVYDVFFPRRNPARQKNEDLVPLAQRFAEAMEKYLEKYPYQWFNFYDYWNQ